ncbi:hypothetical protein [Brucella intermedia]|uniref:hypothetical protein n=1 Tax=Brucella intermedia TaxID=94625 RepID=UPI0009897BF7|nr:hypothetical protein [Brucella intermedia]OOC65152.1 hypothetical protein AS855_20750 [Brucella intermedia M86]
MPDIAKEFKHIKVTAYPNIIALSVATDDVWFSFRNNYDVSEMNDFDKTVIEFALTAIAQGRDLYLLGSYEGDGHRNGPLNITAAIVATPKN